MDTDDDSDPVLARVRRDLAHLGTDASSAADVPAHVTARIGAALRSADRGPLHSVRPSRLSRLQVLGLIAGASAVLVGVIVGAWVLTRGSEPALSHGPTARQITVSRAAPGIPLSHAQMAALLSATPDYGPLADPQRRGSCLNGLGHSAATAVLGARPLEMDGRPAVLLLLPGESPDAVVAVAVEQHCSATLPGRLAETVLTGVNRVARP
jgi:hypothetical protein